MLIDMPEHMCILQAQSLGLTGFSAHAKLQFSSDSLPARSIFAEYIWSFEIYYYAAPMLLCGVHYATVTHQEQTRIALVVATIGDEGLYAWQNPAPFYIVLDGANNPLPEAIKTVNMLPPKDCEPVPGTTSVSFTFRLSTWSSTSTFDFGGRLKDDSINRLWQAAKDTLIAVIVQYDDPSLFKIMNQGKVR